MTKNPTRDLLLRMAPSIYGPTVLFTLGQSALVPLIPVIAVGMGAGIGLSGLIASALVVGQLIGNLPAGWLVARSGERVAMLVATAVALLGAVGVALAPTVSLLGVAVFVIGFAGATFGLARHSFMTTRVPVAFRARALSLIGGSHRLGRFGGPFLAAGLFTLTGIATAPVWAFAVCLFLTAALVAFAPDPERVLPVQVPAGEPEPRTAGVRAAVRHSRAPLVRVGGSAAVLSGLRSIKDVFLPLWAVSIGMDPAGVALVVGIAGTVDLALFYTSGQVMDRFGRLAAALPATVGMAVAFLALAFTHDLANASSWLIGCAIVIGIGNGLSSGIVLTLGADLAPQAEPAAFLSAWRTLVDFGGAAAPLAISAIAAASLPLASVAAGTLAVLGAAGFARWVPRYIPRSRPDNSG